MRNFFQPTRVTYTITAVILLMLLVVVALGFFMSDTFGPVLITIIYAPLFLFDLIGLPVYGRASEIMWASPNVFGYILDIAVYVLLAYCIGSVVSFFKKPEALS